MKIALLVAVLLSTVALARTTLGKQPWCREHDSGIRYCQYGSKVMCKTYIQQLVNPKEWSCVKRK